jgi:hypothetical protein
LPSKLKAITSELNTIQGANFTVEIEYRNIAPAVVNNRITHEWMDSLASQVGGEFVGLHMSAAQAAKWGIRPSIRGASQIDDDLVHEFYFWADERTKRMGRDQFTETLIHEFRHGFMRGCGFLDDTHAVHADGDIRGAFLGLKMASYSPRQRVIERKLTLIEKLRAIIKSMTPNSLYKQAIKFLNTDASPKDIAPDSVGCADSVSTIIQTVLPDFPVITGTYTLWQRLEKDARFVKVNVAKPGDVIISPTGLSKSTKVRNGHVGIFGEGDKIMSNTSANGKWEQNYTLPTWKKRWETAGYPIFIYHLK